jgi:acetylornithine/succinyldiaminopimelate/putrescine aminotransferase
MKKFVAWSNDKKNLFNSSSGGIFFELAKKMIEKYESERKTIILKVRNFDKNVIFNNL